METEKQETIWNECLAAAAELARREQVRGGTKPVEGAQVGGQLRRLVDHVMGDAACYAPEAAAAALVAAEGDAAEATVWLRAWRASLARRYESAALDTRGMVIERRISSAFREIPGGQLLGPTVDYSQRLLEAGLATETAAEQAAGVAAFRAETTTRPVKAVRVFSKVTELLRAEGLLRPATEEDTRVQDVTREPLRFPAPRSARLQCLAGGDTGAIMALAYSGMRGQGGDHPTIGEVRVGRAAVRVADRRGRGRTIGRIRVTEAENISKIKVKKKDPVPYLSLGYGLCFGQNETKAICMGMLDRGMRMGGDDAPAVSQEFVLYHTAGADAWGAIQSLKMPGHAAFESELGQLRGAVARAEAAKARARERSGAAVESPR